jgi:release factor glutamine methyltransferase
VSRTWQKAIADTERMLDAAHIEDAGTNALYLAASIIGVWSKAELKPFLNSLLSDSDEKQFQDLISRRLQHEPLQYIIGETEFFGMRLFCTPAALIPRPETEILVEEALQEANSLQDIQKDIRVLDIGTGSGAIVLALASKLPNARCVGIDVSDDALALAEKNRVRHQLQNVQFLNFDFLSGGIHRRFDLIVSNPPYIPANELSDLSEEVRSFEPMQALTDGADGFTFYHALAKKAPELLSEHGVIAVETEFKGASRVREIFSTHGLKIERTVKDLLGFERVIIASLK